MQRALPPEDLKGFKPFFEFYGTMMMRFITRRGEGQGKTKKERKATKNEGRGLEEGASRALMRRDCN